MTTQFLKLESVLDDSVGQKIELLIERGGIPATVNLTVSFMIFQIALDIPYACACVCVHFFLISVSGCQYVPFFFP